MGDTIYIFDNVLIFLPLQEKELKQWLVANDYDRIPFTFISGEKDYLGIINLEGMPFGDEHRMLIRLSKDFNDKVFYSFWTNESDPNCFHYLDGKQVKSESKRVIPFGKSLGILLPDIVDTAPKVLKSLCLIKSVNEKTFLDNFSEEIKGNAFVAFQEIDSNIILYSIDEKCDATVFYNYLIDAFLEKEIISIAIHDKENRMLFDIYTIEGEENYFTIPPWPDIEDTIDNIEGETEPQKILDKLGIPKEIMSYK